MSGQFIIKTKTIIVVRVITKNWMLKEQIRWKEIARKFFRLDKFEKQKGTPKRHIIN